jgi:23S rRNA (guanosine2251-2'-O)-methyltransferase
MRTIVLIAHNLRSCHNVGSLLRTAEGLGVHTVYLTGYTPYPLETTEQRMPHEAQKIQKQIQKTALGAEESQPWEHTADVFTVIDELRAADYTLVAVEQNIQSIALPKYQPPNNIALVVGREVEGIEPEVIAALDATLEIPMFGSKESFNVVQAAAMALYHCRFYS